MQCNKLLAYLLIPILILQCLSGCSDQSQSLSNNSNIPEQFINESFIESNTISEDNITEQFILENIKYEDYAYELHINEKFYCEAYIIEATISETTVEDLRSQLPDDIDNYIIDWPAVIGKFAVGTAVIITVGIVHHYTKGSSYYFFASPAKVLKDALICGSMNAVINSIKKSKTGIFSKNEIKKYAIEGFADGFMWGAIGSTVNSVVKFLKFPKTLIFSDGSKAKISKDGSVINNIGENIGKAYYSPQGIYIQNPTDNIFKYLFTTRGKQITDPNPTIFSAMAEGRLNANTIYQLGYEDNSQLLKTDNVGIIFQADNKLLPNISYQLNGYKYYTDDQGRIVKVIFDNLKLKNHNNRLPIMNNIEEIGRGFQKITDDRGHLIADRFDGDNSLANIIPMNSSLNKGEYKAMENSWVEALQKGDKVSGSIELVYPDEKSFRPDIIDVLYKINENVFTEVFNNL